MLARLLKLALGAVLIATPLIARPTVDVPLGTTPLVDQAADASTWQDAARVALPDDAALFLKADGDHLYVAIVPAQPAIFGADLFIQDSADNVFDLHASSYLGERSRHDGAWPDWRWWNNDRWTASIAAYEMKDGRLTFVPARAKIFQLSRQRFSAPSYRVRIAYRLSRERPETIFPAGSTEAATEEWLTVRIPPADPASEHLGAFAAISVADMDRSLEWYRDTLGFDVHSSGTVPQRGIRFALLQRGNALIELLQFPDAKSRQEAAPQIREAHLLHGIFKAGLVVADIDALYATLKERNVPFAYPLGQPPHGPYRSFGLQDPDQNLIQIFGR